MLKKDQMVKGATVKMVKDREFPLGIVADASEYFNNIYNSIGDPKSFIVLKIGDELEILDGYDSVTGKIETVIAVRIIATGDEGYTYWGDFRYGCDQTSAKTVVVPVVPKVLKPHTLKQGYYVRGVYGKDMDVCVSYCTGVRGGGMHCYIRSDWQTGKFDTNQKSHSKFKNGWVTLQWNCHDKNGVYHATCPSFIKDWK